MTDPLTADETPTLVQAPVGHIAESAVTAPPPEPPAAPPAQSPVPGHAATELIVCPECGTSAMVTLNRRESADFCRSCDFPLFWTPGAVLRDPSTQLADDALRRLPGTVGRATVASQTCPHCAEPNALSAQVCVRCGRSMHVDAPPPAPLPVYLPPPPQEPVYEEPAKGVAWWVWVLIVLGFVITVVLIVLAANHAFD